MQADMAAQEKQLECLRGARDEAQVALDRLRRQEALPNCALAGTTFKESLGVLVAQAGIPPEIVSQFHSLVDKAISLLPTIDDPNEQSRKEQEDLDTKRRKLDHEAASVPVPMEATEEGKGELEDRALSEARSAWAAELPYLRAGETGEQLALRRAEWLGQCPADRRLHRHHPYGSDGAARPRVVD